MLPIDVLDFWFGPIAHNQAYPADKADLWFRKSDETDQAISEKFGAAVELAQTGGLTEWEANPQNRLALIILLDQFSRNIFRNSPKAFQADERGYLLAVEGLALGMDQELAQIEKVFFYLPLEHCERASAQQLSIQKFEQLIQNSDSAFQPMAKNYLEYAKRHKVIIDRFGRYPHRNAILGRTSSAEEAAFLLTPGSGF